MIISSRFAELTDGYIRKVLTGDFAEDNDQKREISYYEARAVLWHIIQLRMTKQNRSWTSDEHNRHVIQQLLGWMLHIKQGETVEIKQGQTTKEITFNLDPTRGFLIQGASGVGKTFLLECFAVLSCWFGLKYKMGILRNIRTEAVFSDSDNNTMRMLKMRKDAVLYLDDIGSEKPMNIYSEKIAPLDVVLPLRKDIQRQYYKQTCGTTNIPFVAYAYSKDELPEHMQNKRNLKLVENPLLKKRERTTFRELFQPITLLGEAKI